MLTLNMNLKGQMDLCGKHSSAYIPRGQGLHLSKVGQSLLSTLAPLYGEKAISWPFQLI